MKEPLFSYENLIKRVRGTGVGLRLEGRGDLVKAFGSK